jgi:predicted  nucleic acid-binding Zn-ribbon protein
VEQHAARVVGTRRAGRCEVAEVRVRMEQHDEVVGLRRRCDIERAQEPCDPVARITAEHPLLAEVHRRVGVDLEVEQVRVLRRGRWTGQLERLGDRDGTVVRARREVRERAQQCGPAHPPTGASLVRRPTGPSMRNASAVGLSGRISQRGRRSPLGETTVALRVFSSHSR